MDIAPSLKKLIAVLSELPGIGPKSARRLAFYLLSKPLEEIKKFAYTITEARKKLVECKECGNISEAQPCPICTDHKRDKTTICVVSFIQDLITIEKTEKYNGLYFILGGVISPIEGKGPSELKINKLKEKINSDKIKEVIIATSPTLEGETTARYIVEKLKPLNIRLTRLGYGLPLGAELEYADEITLTHSLERRKVI